jgi:hypothetical protein
MVGMRPPSLTLSPSVTIPPCLVPFRSRLLPACRRPALIDPDYWIWCGSAVAGDDGRFHLFATRWPKGVPFFSGYPIYSEIVRADADRPEGSYIMREVVLPDRGEDAWDGRMTHNPTIIRHQGKFLLFYIGSTFSGKRASAAALHAEDGDAMAQNRESYDNIRIGLAVADSVLGPWKRCDAPILNPRVGCWDSTITTNPAPCVAPDGSIYLYYRSNTPDGCRLGVSRAAAPADANWLNARFERICDDPIMRFDNGATLEDPFVWHNGTHFEMLAKDLAGEFTPEYHGGVHGWSLDGIVWQVAPDAQAYSRTVAWDDGTRSSLGSLERPQLLFQNGTPTHLFAAAADGPGGFCKATDTWNLVMPLR